jgi:UDP-N-acetylmuramoyl-L-alanyl-D-glutamate--2,6-diaminopimelate ligase
MLSFFKKLVPRQLLELLRVPYHYVLALFSALWYRFPSRELIVIGVTGTKGKSTVVELVNAILEEAHYKTAVAGTIRFKIGEQSEPNLFKMTMPGRFFMQRFLRRAVSSGCRYAVIEMTSEGVKQFRHKFIELDALIFTNLAPEHIESHGSYEKYLGAKLELAKALARSRKPRRAMVANIDDPHGQQFFAASGAARKIPYSLKDAEPFTLSEKGINFTFGGISMHSKLLGQFNLMNILAATTTAKSYDISYEVMGRAVSKVHRIPGRVEFVDEGQPFQVVVDYAHTPDSLRALYGAFAGNPSTSPSILKSSGLKGSGQFSPKRKLICVLGATGGGRDTWKRPEMGKVADEYCDVAILTNEDPYDEDPRKIVEDIARGFSKHKPEIIMDRREAIGRALRLAQGSNQNNTVVLITGKGTDPYIMRVRGAKESWSDAGVTRNELKPPLGSRASKWGLDVA